MITMSHCGSFDVSPICSLRTCITATGCTRCDNLAIYNDQLRLNEVARVSCLFSLTSPEQQQQPQSLVDQCLYTSATKPYVIQRQIHPSYEPISAILSLQVLRDCPIPFDGALHNDWCATATRGHGRITVHSFILLVDVLSDPKP